MTSEAGETLALDLTITREQRRAGLLRAAVRLIQEARKATALDVSDRIELWWLADDEELAQALREGCGVVAAEVLAVTCEEGRPRADLAPHRDDELGLTFWLRAVGG